MPGRFIRASHFIGGGIISLSLSRWENIDVCREYRGRGAAGSQLDEEPVPCHFCLLKILYMAQVANFLTGFDLYFLC